MDLLYYLLGITLLFPGPGLGTLALLLIGRPLLHRFRVYRVRRMLPTLAAQAILDPRRAGRMAGYRLPRGW